MNDGMNAPGPSNDDYETPGWLFKALNAEFGFTYDGAADERNTKLDRWFPQHNRTHNDRVFTNPPYSTIEAFVSMAFAHYGLTVLLLPNRTDTGWFRRLIESPRVELRFFRKRVRFCLNGKEAESPRFGTIVAIVRPGG